MGQSDLFAPEDSIAITVKCADISGAWEFVRTLLHESFQRNYITRHFPVNKVVFQENLAAAMDSRYEWYFGYQSDFDGLLNIRIHAISQDEADTINMILENSSILFEGMALLNIISETSSDYFNDKINAQEAARIIQSRASIYISEQS